MAIGYFVESYSYRKIVRMRRKIDYLSNEYGMASQGDAQADDWQIFYCTHLRRYIESKKSKRLGTLAEADMIRELIYEHWQKVRRSPLVANLGADRKLLLYQKIVIIFPFFDVPQHIEYTTVHVDFTRKGRLLPSSRCFCGTGLPFKVCCGRIRGQDELLVGEF